MDGEGMMIKYNDRSSKAYNMARQDRNKFFKYQDGKCYEQKIENGVLVYKKSKDPDIEEEDKKLIEEECHDIVPDNINLKHDTFRYDPASRMLRKSSSSLSRVGYNRFNNKKINNKQSRVGLTKNNQSSLVDSITVIHKSHARSEIINIPEATNFDKIPKLPSIIFENPHISKWTVKDV